MSAAVQITDQTGDGRPLLTLQVNIFRQFGAGGVLSAIDQIAERFQIVRAGKQIRLSRRTFAAQRAIRRLGRSRLRDGQLVRLRFRCPDRGRQQADDHYKGHQQG